MKRKWFVSTVEVFVKLHHELKKMLNSTENALFFSYVKVLNKNSYFVHC